MSSSQIDAEIIQIFVENKPELEPRIAALLNPAEQKLFNDAKVWALA
jgi:hypothetical protein